MNIIPYRLLKRVMHSGESMFDLNFIAEPGIQTENSDDCWSFLHKRKANNEQPVKKGKGSGNFEAKSINSFYIGGLCLILIIAGFSYYNLSKQKVSPEMVLNQVVDLIIESGYMKDLQLEEALFSPQTVKVTIKADQLSLLQDFIHGYRKEDNIPFEIFQKNNKSYVSLNFPWEGGKKGGDIDILKSLAAKTVFSNKISINYNSNKFELEGRSSDIISFLLQMAENRLIQKFILSIHHLESGRFFLKIQVG